MGIKNIARLLLLTLGIIGILVLWSEKNPGQLLSPFVQQSKPVTPLLKYSFPELRQRVYPGSKIKIGKKLSPAIAIGDKVRPCQSYVFTFQTEGKTVSGLINIPKRSEKSEAGSEKLPVIVMIRGYADVEGYTTGLGTKKPAEFFCQNGFITLAPDFLGFGESDQASGDILEARFEKPVTVMNLLASIKNPTSTFTLNEVNVLPINPDQIFLWGHSNGGQIVLSVLEISQANIPTVLWAPVTAGFPESVLGYLGELDDNGLRVKNAIDNFLKIYDPKLFSIDNYWSDINTQIQLHQGLADPLVTEEESDKFVDRLKSLGKDISIYKYPNNDHNLSKDWDKVVETSLKFYQDKLR